MLIGHDDGGLLALMAAQRVQTSMNSFNVSISSCSLLLSRLLNQFDELHGAAWLLFGSTCTVKSGPIELKKLVGVYYDS